MNTSVSAAWLERSGLGALLSLLKQRGYRTVGPRARDGAIVYDDVDGLDELPSGWTAEQGPGHYRLVRGQESRIFDYAVGPHSWKRYFHSPSVKLAETRDGQSWTKAEEPAEPPVAILGARPCELAALRIQDRVMLSGPFKDPHYEARRKGAFLIAVNCTVPGNTCFCASMSSGPAATEGFDLVLTEQDAGYVIQAGSDAGREVMSALPVRAASDQEVRAADEELDEARGRMGRNLNTKGLAPLLAANLDNPIWDQIAQRCMACGNCTLACPTCFCTTVDDRSSLAGPEAERVRRWDSCFSAEFARVHGGSFRGTVRDRYRQWMTHKLSSWTEQFGTNGCAGCGRCITWCPAGIDITEEARKIRENPLPGTVAAASQVQISPRVFQKPPSSCLEDGSMVPVAAKVLEIEEEAYATRTLHLELLGPAAKRFRFEPGQFNMLSLPGVGEAAISISSSPLHPGQFSHTIRIVGSVTKALGGLAPGNKVGVRGPFGSSWPVELAKGCDVVIVAGGIGLAPLRPAICHILANRKQYGRVQLLYGARTPDDILYSRDMVAWSSLQPGIEVLVTVDAADEEWTGNVGVVTSLFGRIQFTSSRAVAMMCGPEVMMRFASRELMRAGIKPEDLFLSMERNMKCAVGFCGHCQYGPHFICKDGPVFRYPQVEKTFWKEGI